MTRSTRTIELDDEDWAEHDKMDKRFTDQGESSLHSINRFAVAAYGARPPEPWEVDFDGMTWRRDEDGEWGAKGCCAASAFENRLLDCIHELTHLEEAP